MASSSDGLDHIKIQLIHGQKKHDMCLQRPLSEAGELLSVGHLAADVATMTGVSTNNQRLIFKGKSLTDMTKSLSSLGMKDGCKVMLIGKKYNAEEESLVNQMEKVKQSVNNTKKKFSDVIQEVDGIHRGFLARELQSDALKKLARRLSACAEEFTRQLEQLDSLSLSSSGQDIKRRRKQLVDQIQENLVQCDGIAQDITEMTTQLQV